MNTITNNTTNNTVNNNREKTTSMKTMTSRTLKTLALVAAGSGLFPFASPQPLQAVLNGGSVFAGSSVTVSQTGVHFHIEVHALTALSQHHLMTNSNVNYLILFGDTTSGTNFWGEELETLDRVRNFTMTGPPNGIGDLVDFTGWDSNSGSPTNSSQPVSKGFVMVNNSAYNSGMNYVIDFYSSWAPGFGPSDLAGFEFHTGFMVLPLGGAPNLIDLLDVSVIPIPVSGIPEPSTYALIGGVGAVALAVLGRRRRRGKV